MDLAPGGKQILTFVSIILSALSIPFFASANVNGEVEQTVRAYFADIPVMIEIARCESKFRQFDIHGAALYGGGSGGMVGVFQIYDTIHRTPASALGFDITTLDGNIGYAKYLYDASGTKPWNASRTCWEHAVSATASFGTDTQALHRRIAQLSSLVTQLQELLAKKQAIEV